QAPEPVLRQVPRNGHRRRPPDLPDQGHRPGGARRHPDRLGHAVRAVRLPEPGSGVWIEFEGGDVSYPIWVGGYWRQGEVPDGVDADVKVIVTAAAGSSQRLPRGV